MKGLNEWLTSAQGVLAALVALVGSALGALRWYKTRREHGLEGREIPLIRLDDTQRARLIDRIWAQRIENGLDRSLGHLAAMQLDLRHAPQLVKLTYQQSPGFGGEIMPLDVAYRSAGNQLAIFGVPGSGKTTQALLLIRKLLEDARRDASAPIPEVFPLASWAQNREPLVEWLGRQLQIRHGFPPRLGESLVYHHSVVPVLDGLDEVDAEHRRACLAAITEFWKHHRGGPIVVCSRLAEYLQLPDRLPFGGAVIVERPRLHEIDRYLLAAGPHWDEVRAALQRGSSELKDLFATPLMLNVAVLAYSNSKPDELCEPGREKPARMLLWSRYVVVMRTRGHERLHLGDEDVEYSEADVSRWLGWVGMQMQASGQTELWLHQWIGERRFRLKVRIVLGVAYGLTVALTGGGLGTGLIMGVVAAVLADETPNFRRTEGATRRGWTGGLSLGLCIGAIFAVLIGLGNGLAPGLIVGLVMGCIAGMPYGLYRAWIDAGPNRETVAPRTPSAIVGNSARIGFVILVGVAGLVALTLGIVAALSEDSVAWFFAGCGIGMLVGLAGVFPFALMCGLGAAVFYYAHRLRLRHHDWGPLRWVQFLEWCCAHLYLRSTGPTYEWVHVELRDYFAQLFLAGHTSRTGDGGILAPPRETTFQDTSSLNKSTSNPDS